MAYFTPMDNWLGRPVVTTSPSEGQFVRFTGKTRQGPNDSPYDLFAEFTEFCKAHPNIQGLILTNPHRDRSLAGRADETRLQQYASYWSNPELKQITPDLQEICVALLENKAALAHLEHLFLNDDLCEFSEVSYLNLNQPMCFLEHFPGLKSFGWRGRAEISRNLVHESLEYLEIQGTDLPKDILRNLRDYTLLPSLKGLTCYFGSSQKSTWDRITDEVLSKEDLLELLRGEIYKDLTHVGLCNILYDNEIEEAIVKSPLPLESLSLACSSIDDFELIQLSEQRKFSVLDVQDTYVSRSLAENLAQSGYTVYHNRERIKSASHLRYALHHE